MSGHPRDSTPRRRSSPDPSPKPRMRCSLDKDLPPLLVIEEAETVAGAKGHKPPLRVQSQGGDHSWGLALHQYKGLKACLKAHGPGAGGEALVALPAVALLVLQQVSLHLLHGVLCRLIVQLQHQHLRWGWQRAQQRLQDTAQQGLRSLANAQGLCLTPVQILISGGGTVVTLGSLDTGVLHLQVCSRRCPRTGAPVPPSQSRPTTLPSTPPCPACYLPCRACHSQVATVFAEENLLDAQPRIITVGIKGAHLPREGDGREWPSGHPSLTPCTPGSQVPGLTLRSGGHSSSPWALRFSLRSVSVRNTLTVLSLYSSRKQTPEASQNRTVPSSCLWAEPGEGYVSQGAWGLECTTQPLKSPTL